MPLNIEQKPFLKACESVSALWSSRANSNRIIHLGSTKAGLRVSGWSEKGSMSVIVDSVVDGNLSAFVDGYNLKAFLRKVSGVVQLSIFEKSVEARCQSAKLRFKNLDEEEPGSPAPKSDWSVSAKAEAWHEALRFVSPAVCKERGRIGLAGACLDIVDREDGRLRLVGIDGVTYRHHEFDGNLIGDFSGQIGSRVTLRGLLSPESLKVMEKLCRGSESEWFIRTNQRNFVFSDDQAVYTSPLISGEMPDYSYFMTYKAPYSATFPLEDLRRAVDIVALAESEISKMEAIRFEWQGTQCKLTNYSNGISGVESVEQVLDLVDPPPPKVGRFNISASRIRAELSTVEGENVTLHFSGKEPVIVAGDREDRRRLVASFV